jgi:hypothetical protein
MEDALRLGGQGHGGNGVEQGLHGWWCVDGLKKSSKKGCYRLLHMP